MFLFPLKLLQYLQDHIIFAAVRVAVKNTTVQMTSVFFDKLNMQLFQGTIMINF